MQELQPAHWIDPKDEIIDVKGDKAAASDGSKKDRLVSCVREMEDLLERAARAASNVAFMDKVRGVRCNAIEIAIAQEQGNANKALLGQAAVS